MTDRTLTPIGSLVSVHHMGEDYYIRWDALRTAEKRALARALRDNTPINRSAWVRASRRLVAHENAHNTH